MKTAEQWKRNWYGDINNVPDDKELVIWIESVMLDSYRAGMEAAAHSIGEVVTSHDECIEECQKWILNAAKTAQLPTV